MQLAQRRSRASRAWRRAISQSGRRTSRRHLAPQRERVLHRHGIRLDEEILEERVEPEVQPRAPSPSRPRAPLCTSRATSRGMRFDATLITPTAPAAMKGSVSESSPERISNSARQRRAQGAHALDRAARFLDRDDVRTSRREPRHGLDADLDAAAAGDAVEDERQLGGLGDFCEVPEEAFLRRLVVIRRDEQRGVAAERAPLPRVSATASVVEFEPVPPMTLQRPRADFTASSMTRICSSWSSVGDSPVVPTGTMPVMPAAIWFLDEPRERGFIDRVVAKRRDERRESACKHKSARF